MFYDKGYHEQVLYQHASAASAIQQHHQHQQQHLHHQQHQNQQLRYETLRDWNLAHPVQRNQQQMFSSHWPATSRVQMENSQRPYSGVEQLLMAAMMEGSYPHRASSYASSVHQAPNQAQTHMEPPQSPQPPSSNPQQHQPPPPPASATTQASAPQFDDPRDLLPTGRGLAYRPQQVLECALGEPDIPVPRNSSELCLYRLLESANLLNYFRTFLHFGGDDVQQLSDADEDEFMEIMDLVGMNKKPLHIRRLQRALSNWRRNQTKNKTSDETSDNFKRPRLDTSMSNLINRCSSPCESRRSNFTGVTLDNSHPATPRSTSSQSFLVVPDHMMAENGSFTTDDNLTNQEPSRHQRPHILVNAPKRIRLFNPTQTSRDQCKTT